MRNDSPKIIDVEYEMSWVAPGFNTSIFNQCPISCSPKAYRNSKWRMMKGNELKNVFCGDDDIYCGGYFEMPAVN